MLIREKLINNYYQIIQTWNRSLVPKSPCFWITWGYNLFSKITQNVLQNRSPKSENLFSKSVQRVTSLVLQNRFSVSPHLFYQNRFSVSAYHPTCSPKSVQRVSVSPHLFSKIGSACQRITSLVLQNQFTNWSKLWYGVIGLYYLKWLISVCYYTRAAQGAVDGW